MNELINVSFIEALDYVNNGNHITYMTREDWPFQLYFCPNSQYLILKSKDDLSPYVISAFDFDYEWTVFNP